METKCTINVSFNIVSSCKRQVNSCTSVADVCDACCRLVSLCISGHDQLQPFLQQRIHCGGPAALSRGAMGETVCQVQGYSFNNRAVPVTRDVAMADAACKVASPPGISMNGRLFAQLLHVSCRAAAHIRARLFVDAMPHASRDASNATSRCDCTDTCSATSEAADVFRRRLRSSDAANVTRAVYA
jgi:hypothetical protein